MLSGCIDKSRKIPYNKEQKRLDGGIMEVTAMEKVMNVAAHIADKFLSAYGQKIDEMKLHKLMYFAQRESFIQKNEPLFHATFYGWKYGPILKEIRSAYKEGTFENIVPQKFENESSLAIVDGVFADYSGKDSWSLSRLTHGEISWKNSRMGIPQDGNGDQPMNDEDIRKDAERIRARREMLAKLGLA